MAITSCQLFSGQSWGVDLWSLQGGLVEGGSPYEGAKDPARCVCCVLHERAIVVMGLPSVDSEWQQRKLGCQMWAKVGGDCLHTVAI